MSPYTLPMSPFALEAAVKEVATMQLPRVVGFAANAANRCLQVALAPGTWIVNAELSKERREVADQIISDLNMAIFPVLKRHFPTESWDLRLTPDDESFARQGITAACLTYRGVGF
jgi:hypothetical protein